MGIEEVSLFPLKRIAFRRRRLQRAEGRDEESLFPPRMMLPSADNAATELGIDDVSAL